MQRIWQASLIALARSPRMTRLVQKHRASSKIASRYVAGVSVDDALGVINLLREQGIRSSAFYLGEYVDREELVSRNVVAKLAVAEALGASGFDAHVSVDPTQIGYQQGPRLARRNACLIAEQIASASNNRPGVHCLMFDMEDSPLVDGTIAIHDELRAAGLPVALTLQAYLRRTEADLVTQLSRGGHVRLVKGAFALRGGMALDSHAAIKENYHQLVRRMMSRDARGAGLYPSIATHDPSIHQLALELAYKNGWRHDEFEFEMLLGVRPNVAADLAERGARIRLYVPFGEDWWPHAARRIGESPRNAWLLIRSLLDRGRYESARRRRPAARRSV